MNWKIIKCRWAAILILGLAPVFVVAQDLNRKQKKTLIKLKKDIAYLASDVLTGRATGTEGERLSAEYIARAFESNKLEPMGGQGFFQKFSITTLRIADKSSIFSLNGEELTLYQDYYPLSYSSNKAEAKSSIIDAGYGIVSDSRNDYEGLDATGKIAFINIGSPDGIHPHSKYLAWHGISIRIDEAIKHGVVAVVFYRNSEDVEKPSGDLSLTMAPSPIPVLFANMIQENAQLHAFASIQIQILTDEDTGYNVIGFNDNGAENTVVIGAHHDHLGHGQHGNSLADNPDEIHNGADDNASGTAALFALSKMLKKSKSWNKNNNYLFIAFSGEEMGLLGSKYFVNHPTIELSSINYMINMDMIGMLNENKVLNINGVGTSPSFSTAIIDLNARLHGINSVTLGNSGIGPSDHTSFYLKNIPSLHYFTGSHEHYHKPSDDIGNLNYEGEVFVIQHLLDVITTLNNQGRVTFTSTKDDTDNNTGKSRSSLTVTLGIVPNYSFDGEGVEVDAVRQEKPGFVAGIKAKDIIISLAGEHIGNLQDYMKVLGGLNKGDNVDVVLRRADELITLNVQF